jgi:hypothetical protein
MADPSFAEMESEVETLLPPAAFSRPRDYKSNPQPHFEDEAETSPLLGPPVLSEQPEKKWYNTPSVDRLISYC